LDPNSVRVTISNPQESPIACGVKLVKESSDSLGSSDVTTFGSTTYVKTGLCTGTFDFYDIAGSHFSDNKYVFAEFSVYASLTDGAAQICASNPKPHSNPKLASYQLPSFVTCPTMSGSLTGTSTYPKYRNHFFDCIFY
jgi:hypothetical protein